MNKTILVYANWQGPPEPTPLGVLRASQARGRETLSFTYEPSWLQSGFATVLDPQLQLVEGSQYDTTGDGFGMLLDSCPDRWGRMLLDRRAALHAREDGEKERKLLETDYLLGISDQTRVGGLRFKLAPDGPFLSDEANLAVPPLSSLRSLEHASLMLEQEEEEGQPPSSRWLNMLLAPGSSLGGARPKASVGDPEGALWIAKFPSRQDDINVGAWEMLVHNMARDAGLHVPEARAQRFSCKRHTFLVKRFDRNGPVRIHYASALNLLGRRDGDGAQEGASYLEIAELITQISENPQTDLEELWRRIVFNICVSNTDDHLRNHGFLFGKHGWRLSPAFDMNPTPWGQGLSLNISEHSNALDIGLALDVAKYFRVSPKLANEAVKKVQSTVSSWQTRAKQAKLPAAEITRMASAFTKIK